MLSGMRLPTRDIPISTVLEASTPTGEPDDRFTFKFIADWKRSRILPMILAAIKELAADFYLVPQGQACDLLELLEEVDDCFELRLCSAPDRPMFHSELLEILQVSQFAGASVSCVVRFTNDAAGPFRAIVGNMQTMPNLPPQTPTTQRQIDRDAVNTSSSIKMNLTAASMNLPPVPEHDSPAEPSAIHDVVPLPPESVPSPVGDAVPAPSAHRHLDPVHETTYDDDPRMPTSHARTPKPYHSSWVNRRQSASPQSFAVLPQQHLQPPDPTWESNDRHSFGYSAPSTSEVYRRRSDARRQSAMPPPTLLR